MTPTKGNASPAATGEALVKQTHLKEFDMKNSTLFDQLSDEEIEAMPPDEFADALFAKVNSAGPLLSCDDMDDIEAMWERQRLNRRAALVLLTKPWAWLNQRVNEDRCFAVIVAQIEMLADEARLYKGLAELMETVSAWSMFALTGREDMSEVRAEARAL